MIKLLSCQTALAKKTLYICAKVCYVEAVKSKDLLGLKELSADEINEILELAAEMKKLLLSGHKKSTRLAGKNIVHLFYENSTRTAVSFDEAAKVLGAVSCNMSVGNSAVKKGENLIDTAKTLNAMKFDAMVIRHPSSGAPHIIAKHVEASVINAGDGRNEHPTQALLDMLTIKEKFGRLDGLKIAIVGDVKHSRVAKSNIYGLSKMGSEIRIAAPDTLLFPESDKLSRNYSVKFFETAEEAVKDADVVMALRLQLERMSTGLIPSIAEYHAFYGVDEKLLKHAKKNVLVMHPGPVNRGVEIASAVMDGDKSIINEQVTSGVAIRMAIMTLLTERGSEVQS